MGKVLSLKLHRYITKHILTEIHGSWSCRNISKLALTVIFLVYTKTVYTRSIYTLNNHCNFDIFVSLEN